MEIIRRTKIKEELPVLLNITSMIASTKSNLKIAEEQIAKGVYLKKQTFIPSCLD